MPSLRKTCVQAVCSQWSSLVQLYVFIHSSLLRVIYQVYNPLFYPQIVRFLPHQTMRLYTYIIRFLTEVKLKLSALSTVLTTTNTIYKHTYNNY